MNNLEEVIFEILIRIGKEGYQHTEYEYKKEWGGNKWIDRLRLLLGLILGHCDWDSLISYYSDHNDNQLYGWYG